MNNSDRSISVNFEDFQKFINNYRTSIANLQDTIKKIYIDIDSANESWKDEVYIKFKGEMDELKEYDNKLSTNVEELDEKIMKRIMEYQNMNI